MIFVLLGAIAVGVVAAMVGTLVSIGWRWKRGGTRVVVEQTVVSDESDEDAWVQIWAW